MTGRRFLFVVPPLTGHMNPTIGLGRELMARGHTVAWAGYPEVSEAAVPEAATFIPVADALDPQVARALHDHLDRNRRGIEAFRFSWDEFALPVARQMLPGLHAAVDRFHPDVLIVDQQAFAGAPVAELRGLPWATSATTSAELVDPLAALPKLKTWLRGRFDGLLVEAGLTPTRATAVDPRFSPHLVVGFTSAALVGPADLTPHTALVGPSITPRPEATPFPWDWIRSDVPLVLVSLGTLNWRGGGRFFTVAAEALADMGAQAVFVAPPGTVPDPPANVLVRSRVPQLALLEYVDAVVSHGGHNTVCETLASGRPLVVAPIRDDQPIVAEQVRRAGAGVRVLFGRVTPQGLRDALHTVLTDPSYRSAAQRLQASFVAAGGPPAAADRLETLTATGAHPPGKTRS